MYLDYCSGVLLVSAVLDLSLWNLTGYNVPSWTLAVLMLAFVVMLWILKREVAIEMD
jgi:peptidoglycan/LPS O-acetylase OafA/YrhL